MTIIGHQDSTGKALYVGDRVRWRGRNYTIKAFGPRGAVSPTLEFHEPLHLNDEIPEEVAVDLVP